MQFSHLDSRGTRYYITSALIKYSVCKLSSLFIFNTPYDIKYYISVSKANTPLLIANIMTVYSTTTAFSFADH